MFKLIVTEKYDFRRSEINFLDFVSQWKFHCLITMPQKQIDLKYNAATDFQKDGVSAINMQFSLLKCLLT
jgi:hypothetical protein